MNDPKQQPNPPPADDDVGLGQRLLGALDRTIPESPGKSALACLIGFPLLLTAVLAGSGTILHKAFEAPAYYPQAGLVAGLGLGFAVGLMGWIGLSILRTERD